jgi:hypothetical protein
MKKRIIFGALAIIFSIGLIFAMSSCDAIFNALVQAASSVSGTVIDARDENGAALSGVSLTLTSIADNAYTFTVTTDTTGDFSFTDLDPEKSPYRLTGSGSISGTTYTLLPLTVELDGLFKQLGNIPALAISVADAEANAFTFILMWPKTSAENGTSNDFDLDLHLTYDKQAQNNATFWFNGDYGNEANFQTQRESVFWNNKTSTVGDITLDVDSNTTAGNTVPGVETISLKLAPIAETAVSTSLTDDTSGDNEYIYGIYGSTTIDWCGYARAYANLYVAEDSSGTPDDTAKLSDVHPILYVVQSYFEEDETDKVQSNAKADLLGIFPLPDTDVAKAASMVRTDFFEDEIGPFWVLSWDGAFFPNGPDTGQNGTFRSLGANFIAGRR